MAGKSFLLRWNGVLCDFGIRKNRTKPTLTQYTTADQEVARVVEANAHKLRKLEERIKTLEEAQVAVSEEVVDG